MRRLALPVGQEENQSCSDCVTQTSCTLCVLCCYTMYRCICASDSTMQQFAVHLLVCACKRSCSSGSSSFQFLKSEEHLCSASHWLQPTQGFCLQFFPALLLVLQYAQRLTGGARSVTLLHWPNPSHQVGIRMMLTCRLQIAG